MKSIFIVLFVSVVVPTAQAQETQLLESIEVKPRQSAQDVLDDQFQSVIKIRQAGTTTVKEYQNQGVTYKVEVAPKDTPAYILSDQDGNGKINNSDTGIDSDVVVPEWTLGNW